ncbi:hypothetical protein [Planococcus chinensis]|uniref:hypothetical protein n=1 Tax=Planococcus chinensis TaxID=272917 RepID=UPI001CC8172C|nr:hypothetical protein [Planococcus chinensis]
MVQQQLLVAVLIHILSMKVNKLQIYFTSLFITLRTARSFCHMPVATSIHTMQITYPFIGQKLIMTLSRRWGNGTERQVIALAKRRVD